MQTMIIQHALHSDASTHLLHGGALAPSRELFDAAFGKFRADRDAFGAAHEYHYSFVPAIEYAVAHPHQDLERMLMTKPPDTK